MPRLQIIVECMQWHLSKFTQARFYFIWIPLEGLLKLLRSVHVRQRRAMEISRYVATSLRDRTRKCSSHRTPPHCPHSLRPNTPACICRTSYAPQGTTGQGFQRRAQRWRHPSPAYLTAAVDKPLLAFYYRACPQVGSLTV
jgi:hypothetical protein